MTVSIITHTVAQQVEPYIPDIVDIYRKAFGQAPYFKSENEVLAFGAIFPHHMRRPSFRCVLAQDEETSNILGFAYGYTGEAGQWWHDLVVKKMARAQAEYWMTNVFEVVELAVYPFTQGHGYGGRIHDALLQTLPHRTAVLSTYQVETPAQKMYEKRGWETLLSGFVFPGYSEPYKIMGKRLT